MIDSALLSPVRGFVFFVLHPRLWFKPLLITFFASLLVGLVFGYSIWGYWPEELGSTWHYLLGVLKAIGLASLISVVMWAFFISILLSYAFDSMMRKALKSEGLLTHEVSFLVSFKIALQVMMRTLGWRIFWPFFTFIAIFFMPFASALIAQIGVGHMAVIDGAGMTMSFLGYDTLKQISVYRMYRASFLSMGVAAGLGSLFLLPTFFIWLFWIPGIYIGVAFWITKELEGRA